MIRIDVKFFYQIRLLGLISNSCKYLGANALRQLNSSKTYSSSSRVNKDRLSTLKMSAIPKTIDNRGEYDWDS